MLDRAFYSTYQRKTEGDHQRHEKILQEHGFTGIMDGSSPASVVRMRNVSPPAQAAGASLLPRHSGDLFGPGSAGKYILCLGHAGASAGMGGDIGVRQTLWNGTIHCCDDPGDASKVKRTPDRLWSGVLFIRFYRIIPNGLY